MNPTSTASKRAKAAVSMTVDLVIFTIRDDQLQVLLVERGHAPFAGEAALPGGYLRGDETLDQAARRELFEETGVNGELLHLEQLHTYSDPYRDPRGRVVTAAYLALGPNMPTPVAGTDAAEAYWKPVKNVLRGRRKLAFDHLSIVRDAVERARMMLEYTTVATAFCVEPFTLGELRHVYETVWGLELDPSNFRRKVTRADGFLLPTGDRRLPVTGRPAALYRKGPARVLVPPFLRSHEEFAAPSSAR